MKNNIQSGFTLIQTIEVHDDAVNLFSIFPSNNISSISNDKSIIIYNTNLEILQKIENSHDDIIFELSIKDENNFATCSRDKTIKTWKNTEEKNINFKLNYIINTTHQNDIHQIIYFPDDSIISCSKDTKIKIFKKVNNEYQCELTLEHSNPVYSILFLEKEKILISSGLLSTCFWDFNNHLNKLIFNLESYCLGKNSLKRLDEDKIIVGGKGLIQIISMKEKRIIKEIDSEFICWTICIIKDRNICLCGGTSCNILIFNINTYEKILEVKNCHDNYIRSINLLYNGNFISGSEDKKIKVWKFKE